MWSIEDVVDDGTGTAGDGWQSTTCSVSTASKTAIVSTCAVTMAPQVRHDSSTYQKTNYKIEKFVPN